MHSNSDDGFLVNDHASEARGYGFLRDHGADSVGAVTGLEVEATSQEGLVFLNLAVDLDGLHAHFRL